MPICSEAGRHPLLAEAKAVVSLWPPFAEFPLAAIQFVRDLQPLAQHVAAADYVPRLQRFVYPVTGFVQVGTGLGYMGREMTWKSGLGKKKSASFWHSCTELHGYIKHLT